MTTNYTCLSRPSDTKTSRAPPTDCTRGSKMRASSISSQVILFRFNTRNLQLVQEAGERRREEQIKRGGGKRSERERVHFNVIILSNFNTLSHTLCLVESYHVIIGPDTAEGFLAIASSIVWQLYHSYLRGYCTSGPYF